MLGKCVQSGKSLGRSSLDSLFNFTIYLFQTNLNRPRITEEEAYDALKAEWHPDISSDDLDKRQAELYIADSKCNYYKPGSHHILTWKWFFIWYG